MRRSPLLDGISCGGPRNVVLFAHSLSRSDAEKSLLDALSLCISAPTVPDIKRLRWVYFATPSKANRSETYELAYTRGVVCSDATNAVGALKPNVRNLRPGDLMLLAYGKGGEYEPQLYLTVEPPSKSPIAGTEVVYELPKELESLLKEAGYSEDPSLGVFTGFRVTPSGDWKGQTPGTLRKPDGQNFLRTWEEVLKKNGWEPDEGSMIRTDPLTGRWTLDSRASQFSLPSPLAWTLDVSAHGTGMTVEENLTQADGTALRVTFAPAFDGCDYPVKGSPIMDSISVVRRSEKLLEASARKADAISMRDTTEVSEDGQTLVVSFSVFSGKQTVADGRAVFRRAS